MRSPRCIWTNERDVPLEALETTGLGPVPWRVRPKTVHVSPEHRERAEAYFDRVERSGKRFLALVLTLAFAPLLALPLGSVVGDAGVLYFVAGTVAGIGVLIQIYPFCTPETITLFGIRRSLTIARYAGVVLLVIAAGIAALAGRS